jgi:hypothetical protein
MHGFFGVIGNDVPEGSPFFAELRYEGKTSPLPIPLYGKAH